MNRDQDTAEQLQYLKELRRRRPEIDHAIVAVLAKHGYASLIEWARTDLDTFDAFHDGLFNLEQEIGDADPGAPNLS